MKKKEKQKEKKVVVKQVKALKFVNFWGVGQHMKIEKI